MTLPTPPGPGGLLPIIGDTPAEPEERSDAARNRRVLLDAAACLVAEHGVDALTMDQLARRADVGKGTVFRRFGSRAGLMQALLDHSEREFQAAFVAGPPPLGPGAEPVDRLVAFGRAKLDLFEIQGELEAGAAEIRYTTAPYLATVTHIRMLLAQADTPGDLRLLADTLLAILDARLVLHQTRVLGIPLSRIADNWTAVVRRVAGRP